MRWEYGAIAAAATVAMTVIASLTLVPALLGFTGHLARPSRLNTFLGGKVFGRASYAKRRAAGTEAGTQARSAKNQLPAAQRWAGVVQKHPVWSSR